jgi:hypothetical protein
MNAPSKGSHFDVDVAKRIIKFKLWGLWEDQHVKAFQDGIRASMQKLGPGPFCVYVDLTESPPQRPEVNKGCQEMMALAVQNGMTKAAHLVNRTMTELQVKRLSDEVGAPNFRFFQSGKEAMDWLMEKRAAA